MNKISIILGLIFVMSSLKAQETRPLRTFNYFNRTDAGFSFGVGNYKTDIYKGVRKTIKNNEIVISLQTINGIAYHRRIGLGVGIGVEKWQHGLFFPLFGQLFYDVKPTENTFFGTLGLGNAFGTRDSTTFYHQGNGGFLFQGSVGYKMKVFKRLRFYYEVFYKYQAIHSSYNRTFQDTIPPSTIDYKIPLHFLGFRIGISFY